MHTWLQKNKFTKEFVEIIGEPLGQDNVMIEIRIHGKQKMRKWIKASNKLSYSMILASGLRNTKNVKIYNGNNDNGLKQCLELTLH